MDAANSKNCAIAIKTPAVMSWSSLMIREVKAKAVATTQQPTAIAYSKTRISSFMGKKTKSFFSCVSLHL